MASPESGPDAAGLAFTSHQSALCLLPPSEISRRANSLRALHDKAFNSWPPHINLIYPFVTRRNLPQALAVLQNSLIAAPTATAKPSIDVCLVSSDVFSRGRTDTWTVYVAPDKASNPAATTDRCAYKTLEDLREFIVRAFHGDTTNASDLAAGTYRPHLTIGQVKAEDSQSREDLLIKAKQICPLQWPAASLAILVRCAPDSHDDSLPCMRIWKVIGLSGQIIHDHSPPATQLGCAQTTSRLLSYAPSHLSLVQKDHTPRSQYVPLMTSSGQRLMKGALHFSTASGLWESCRSSSTSASEYHLLKEVSVSSYNVLSSSPVIPESQRYSLLIATLLADSSTADVLVLQEVSNDFLSRLLRDTGIQRKWPFTTHGPPSQSDCPMLADICNIVVLSKTSFLWESVDFKQNHKGAIVIQMDRIGTFREDAEAKTTGNPPYSSISQLSPLTIAGVHFTSGLNDEAVSAKASQLEALLAHLTREHGSSPWIIAGDMNVATSAVTIESALRKGMLDLESASTLDDWDLIQAEAGLTDAWLAARLKNCVAHALTATALDADELQDGEEGATFDPLSNVLAAEGAKSCGDRPQRYDRILFKGNGVLDISNFNLFGLEDSLTGGTNSSHGLRGYGSDHWGIRAGFDVKTVTGPSDMEAVTSIRQISISRPRSEQLAGAKQLEQMLRKRGEIPSQEEMSKRKAAFCLLRSVLVQENQDSASTDISLARNRSGVFLNLVAVGSYGLGVWSNSSDIDCLCIGSISTKTFFALARQRIVRANVMGISIVRFVAASTGMMLELVINGIKCDLQYAPAPDLAASWNNLAVMPAADSVFRLPVASLKKLNAFRDMTFLLNTIPDLSTFRLAYRIIKQWARHRGLYSAKFGFLSGSHITMMLSPLCKTIFHEQGSLRVEDVISTFFAHYAAFDWGSKLVLDPYFHSGPLRYQRTSQEPMVILSLHRPVVNVARTALVSSLRTLISELHRAHSILLSPLSTWSSLVGDDSEDVQTEAGWSEGVTDFLRNYRTYVRIDVQCWNMSRTRSRRFMGWLESKCLVLLSSLDKKLPSLHARIWPGRFTEKSPTPSEQEEHRGYYLIGLSRIANPLDESLDKLDQQKLQPVLQRSMDDFADQLRGNDQFFDKETSWLDVRHVKNNELGELILDETDWHDGSQDDACSLDDDDLDEYAESADDQVALGSTTKSSVTDKTLRTNVKPGQPAAKLRPAVDVLNRIRWDPGLDGNDHVIGYEDRFAGTKEIPFDKWKADSTDEEFIPQHRIIYFRRKSDGALVWDRRSRKDEIFGSGDRTG